MMAPDRNKFFWTKSAPGGMGASETRQGTCCPMKNYREKFR